MFILSYIVQYCTSYCIPGSSPSNSHSAPPGSYSDRTPSYRPSSTLPSRQRSRPVNDLEDASLSRPLPARALARPGAGPARSRPRCSGGPGRRRGVTVRFGVRVQDGPAAAVDVKATGCYNHDGPDISALLLDLDPGHHHCIVSESRSVRKNSNTGLTPKS